MWPFVRVRVNGRSVSFRFFVPHSVRHLAYYFRKGRNRGRRGSYLEVVSFSYFQHIFTSTDRIPSTLKRICLHSRLLLSAGHTPTDVSK